MPKKWISLLLSIRINILYSGSKHWETPANDVTCVTSLSAIALAQLSIRRDTVEGGWSTVLLTRSLNATAVLQHIPYRVPRRNELRPNLVVQLTVRLLHAVRFAWKQKLLQLLDIRINIMD